ncbi:ClpP/crotonase-like domain-containing protein [Penicillium alfredii]|uniref:ClpP/crotonase-like domain-containing protein n=1 Tax=Penicillium alfredii TaxID=1506179 RepID=A0A9W9KG89_9EURO|nr:ClpP/crotonase-like domain-containing protein [Penicillium alfredii]KAJ5105419.1 ClpP/crotonase-like domain-containing protein [Penicillium alfredii]
MADDLGTNLVQLQDLKNGVLLIKLNKPQSGNSLHPVLLADLRQVIQWANQQNTVQIIVLTGNGPFFCTGMELISDEEISFALGADFHQLNKELILSEKILIAAVNGPAVGYGTTCLALFDLVYSVPEAYFFLPFIKWGFLPEATASFSFGRMMGHQRASSLFLTGERIFAPEAERLGLVSRVLLSENFLGQVLAIADSIDRSPGGSLQATKRLMKHPLVKDLLDTNDRECRLLQEERMSSDNVKYAKEQFKIERGRKRRERQEVKASL